MNQGWLVFYGPPQLALQTFKVQEFSDIYDVLAKFEPAALAHQYTQSSIYRKYITARLAKRYKTEQIDNTPHADLSQSSRRTSDAKTDSSSRPRPVQSEEQELSADRSIEEELEALKRRLKAE